MKFTEIRPAVFLATCESQYELTSTFLRLQEFYESPYKNIRGKYFTLEDYMDAYAKDRGKFTYFEDWNGFNVPSNVFYRFFDKFGCNLGKKEANLIFTIDDLGKDYKKFYLIGCLEGAEDTMKHELAHAMFYLNKDYKSEMLALIDDNKKAIKVCKDILIKMGYCKQVLNDEVQAYFSTGLTGKMETLIKNKRYINKFEKVFNKYYGKTN